MVPGDRSKGSTPGIKKKWDQSPGRRLGKGGTPEIRPQGISSWDCGHCNVLMVLPLGMKVSINNTKSVKALIGSVCFHVYMNKVVLSPVPMSVFGVSHQKGEPGKQNPRPVCRTLHKVPNLCLWVLFRSLEPFAILWTRAHFSHSKLRKTRTI